MPRRKKTQSDALKHDTEDSPDRSPPPKPRRKGKNRVKNESDETEKVEKGTSVFTSEIDWTPELSQSLVNNILDNYEVKIGLYPGPGQHASTKNGGGKPKTDHYFALAEALFGNEPHWPKDAAKNSKLRTQICNKIKNRLKRMSEEVHRVNELMGQTGQGLTSKEDIDMTLENKLTRTWRDVQETCPWYFDMKALISERPNSVPIGLGNSTTPIDMSILNGTDDFTDPTDGFSDGQGEDVKDSMDIDIDTANQKNPVGSTPLARSSASLQSDMDEDDAPDIPKPRNPAKRKASAGVMVPRTPASQPPTKKLKITGEFSQVTEGFSTTRQKSLELAKEREISKRREIELKASLKMEKLRMKQQRNTEKHQRKLAKYQNDAQMISSMAASSSSNTPSSQAIGDGLNGLNRLQGSSELHGTADFLLPPSDLASYFNERTY